MRSVILPTILLALGSAVLSAQNTSDSGSINLRKTVTTEVVQKTKDAVVNISTPLGFSHSVSTGIVSVVRGDLVGFKILDL